MAIQLNFNNPCLNADIEGNILSQCDLNTALGCRTVCSLWNTIILNPNFLCQTEAEIAALCERNCIPFLIEHGVCSEEKLMARFENFVSRIPPSEAFSFTCKSAHNRGPRLELHKEFSVVNDGNQSVKLPCSPENHDSCVFLKPLKCPAGKASIHGFFLPWEPTCPSMKFPCTIIINIGCDWTQPISVEQVNRIHDQFQGIMLRHGHLNLGAIVPRIGKHIFYLFPAKETLMKCGGLLLGLGSLAYYTYRNFLSWAPKTKGNGQPNLSKIALSLLAVLKHYLAHSRSNEGFSRYF